MRTILTVVLLVSSIDLSDGFNYSYSSPSTKRNNFSASFKFIRSNEGFFSNHPKDKGGLTFLGITHKWNKSWVGWRNPNKITLAKLYYYKIWHSEGFEQIGDSSISKALFDTRISLGKKNCIKLLNFCRVADVKHSKKWINSSLDTLNLERLRQCRCRFYQRIVKRDSSQRVFLRGWLNRANKI